MTIIYNFEQWQKAQIENIMPSEELKCSKCDGNGVVEDECDCCGHESEQECELCGGNGTVIFGDLSEHEQKQQFDHMAYRKHLIDDIAALASWTGKNRVSLLLECGLTVYYLIRNKEEVIIDYVPVKTTPKEPAPCAT